MKKADTIIHDCLILPMNRKNRIIEHGLIAIENSKVTYVGKKARFSSFKAENIIDAHGKIAMPGLVNCHTHLPMTLFRGIAEDQPLDKWLTETIWPLEAKLQPDDIYNGALLGCLEMIKSGTTCFADMYFHEEKVAEALEKAGLRAVLAQGIIEAGDKERGERMFKENVEFAKKYNAYADGRVTTQLGPHAIYSCSPELLTKVREAASKFNLGIHIHLAESKEMAKEIKEKFGFSEVELLENLKFLSSDILAAHCIHLSESEMSLMAKHNVKIAYNPVANMKIAVGVARIKDLMDFGLTVGIGTDGSASNNSLDMFESVKIAALLQKLHYQDSTVLPAEKVVEMATIDGAKALRIEDFVGSLEVGKEADLILVDFRKPHLTPMHDPYANIVYSARGSDVDTVIVKGKILMENRDVKTLDEDEVMRDAEKTAFDLLTRHTRKNA
jgi:5-methylthioadenosine/S-adenosylhomocysteine deaminase